MISTKLIKMLFHHLGFIRKESDTCRFRVCQEKQKGLFIEQLIKTYPYNKINKRDYIHVYIHEGTTKIYYNSNVIVLTHKEFSQLFASDLRNFIISEILE